MSRASCETSTSPPLKFAMASVRASTDSMSRWFVGSSRRSSVGSAKSALASATRILHPPDMSSVFRWIIVSVNPSAWRSSAARDSNVFGSISSRRS
mmetsp:Transcript_49255/g.118404  ORF Transcript_49255/g.118404 Transcript_49255/m.118404 type:complete len:96 (-) Transcript_49255:632-919(-)